MRRAQKESVLTSCFKMSKLSTSKRRMQHKCVQIVKIVQAVQSILQQKRLRANAGFVKTDCQTQHLPCPLKTEYHEKKLGTLAGINHFGQSLGVLASKFV